MEDIMKAYEESLRSSLRIPDEYIFVPTGKLSIALFDELVECLNKCPHPVKYVTASKVPERSANGKTLSAYGKAEFFIHPLGFQYMKAWADQQN